MNNSKVFPLRTYTARKRTDFSQKCVLEPDSVQGCQTTKDKASMKKRSQKAEKSLRKEKLKSSRRRSGRKKKRKTEVKQKTNRSPQQFELTFGMFGSDAECRTEGLMSEDPGGKKLHPINSKITNTYTYCEIDPAVETLPSEEMERQDRVKAWLSRQNPDDNNESRQTINDCDESSIEIMREEVVTAAERKEKCFPGRFYENMNKVLHAATGLGQQKDRWADELSDDEISIIGSPVVEYTSTALTGTELTGRPTTCQSTETGTYFTATYQTSAAYTTSTNLRSSTAQSSEVKTSADFYTDEVTVLDSLKEKAKSEKTPGKKTSFVIPGSPKKAQKSKSQRKSAPDSVPRSSTRLFMTNIDQGDEIPQISSIHGDTDQEARFINSEVFASGGQGKVKTNLELHSLQYTTNAEFVPGTQSRLHEVVPLTPEILVINKQPFPRLTSTPNRKTSTPNTDGCKLTQFELDLSSVSLVHSDEEGLLLPQSDREVLSEEHMDLSMTRIEEHIGEYIRQPVGDKVLLANENTSPRSATKQALNKESVRSIQLCDTDGSSEKKLKVKKRKTNAKCPSGMIEPLARCCVQTEMEDVSSRDKKCHQSRSHQVECVTTEEMERQNLLPLKSFASSFFIKSRHKSSMSEKRVSQKYLPVCSLHGNFVCPNRNTNVWLFQRDCQISNRERLAVLPRDDLDF